MSDQIEELIREIAAKHGIAVSRDDPILVLQTINNRLLQDSAKAQQKEAIQAQIERLEEMIQSMKENGLPEEDIKAFTELKRAMEEQQIAEPEPSKANRPEPTVVEIKNDFAASFEQAGMPPAERDRMIEDLFSSLKSTNESAGDLNVEPSLPLPAEERIK